MRNDDIPGIDLDVLKRLSAAIWVVRKSVHAILAASVDASNRQSWWKTTYGAFRSLFLSHRGDLLA